MAKLEINAERCKSCGFCVAVCPKKVLEPGERINSRGYRYIHAAKEELCVACAMCAQMCPDEAISIYR